MIRSEEFQIRLFDHKIFDHQNFEMNVEICSINIFLIKKNSTSEED